MVRDVDDTPPDYPVEAYIADDEPVIAREPEPAEHRDDDQRDDDQRDAPAVPASPIDTETRGAVAIALLAPRVARLREQLAALAREASALRGAVTRAERRAPETVLPASVSSSWPLGRAIAALELEIDGLDPHGPCDHCAGAGCVRCSQTGWISVRTRRERP